MAARRSRRVAILDRMTAHTSPPLHGVQVLDISHNLAGPLATMHLGDLGADVVKVEPPWGDDWREHEAIAGHAGMSRHYLQVNRNKRSIALDLRTEAARAVLERLVLRSDVLVTNMRTGVAERLGFGWERCRELNERLVYCDLTGFGTVGPLAGRRGYDEVVQARAGFTVPPSGRDDRPRASPIPVNDTALPLLAGMAIMAALLERARSGLGQRVALSLLQCAVALNAHALVRLDDAPTATTPRFSRALFRTYRTSDGWIAVAANAERLGRAFCAAIGLPGLLDDTRFADRAERVRNEDVLVGIVAERLLTRDTVAWEALLTDAGVPAGPVNARDALFDDEQVAAMGLLQVVRDPELGRVTMVSPVAALSRTPGSIRFPARVLGADSRDILRELGETEEGIAALIAAGACLAREAATGAAARAARTASR